VAQALCLVGCIAVRLVVQQAVTGDGGSRGRLDPERSKDINSHKNKDHVLPAGGPPLARLGYTAGTNEQRIFNTSVPRAGSVAVCSNQPAAREKKAIVKPLD
jgi:hypothetical protein